MFLRSTTQATTNSMIEYILNNQGKYNEIAGDIATQKKLNRPSDSPVDAISVLNTNKELSQLNGYLNSMTNAQNELDVADNAYASITSSLQKANDLAVQASNGTNTPSSLANIKVQVDQLIQNVVDLGNTQFNGIYIFSGTDTGTVPFQQAAGGGISYNGNDSQRTAQVSDGVNVAINEPGSKLLGSYDATTKTGSGTLQALYQLSEALGKNPPDFTAIRSTISGIDTALKNTSTIRTNFASVTNRFKMSQNSINTNILQLKGYKSSLEDLDLASAITNLTTQETALQATMAVASKSLNQASLMNYM